MVHGLQTGEVAALVVAVQQAKTTPEETEIRQLRPPRKVATEERHPQQLTQMAMGLVAVVVLVQLVRLRLVKTEATAEQVRLQALLDRLLRMLAEVVVVLMDQQKAREVLAVVVMQGHLQPLERQTPEAGVVAQKAAQVLRNLSAQQGDPVL